MQLEERVVGDVAIVKVIGPVTSGGGDVLLRDKIQSLLQQDFRSMLLDLAEVPYVDSAGLGQIVGVYATTRKHGGTLKLVHVTRRLHDLLVISKLLTVFETFDSEADAIASFGRGAEGVRLTLS